MITSWNSVVDDTRNDIVFEGRNQNYGAYQIRRRYNWTVTIILGCMIGALAMGMGIKTLLSLKSDEAVEAPVLDMTTVDLTPPPVDKNEPPPPPPPPPPPLMKTIAFVPPVIKDDAVETDPPPPQEKIAETQVSTATQEGDGDVVQIPTDAGTGTGVIEEKAPEIFTVVEEMPEFPGGAAEMMKFIQKNIQYPQMAKEAGLSGKCFLKFVVDGSGNISGVQVLKGVPGCKECDQEAIRVVKAMPNWKAGKQNGRPVNVYFNLPINFQLR